jgi:hypothetical protein
MSSLSLDPKVWGPHYWFFLHTIAMTYPNHPNAITKRTYYEFVQNISTFIPVEHMAKDFKELINEYPVQPYLDNRESFVRWVWFIHNKINKKLEKETISLSEFSIRYYNEYKSTNEKMADYYKIREKVIFCILLLTGVSSIYYLYDK